jgi:hypothetical protein
MSTNIIPFSAAGKDVPEHIAYVFGEDSNIAPRISIDQLSYRGKVWRRIVGGEETQLTRPNADGDTEPVPIVSVVVLDHNKGRSRAFYEGAYEEGKNASPTCYSGDGVTPDASVKEPCAKTCATCPNSVKGSKITENGKQSTLCSPFKRVAIVPSQAVGTHPVMLLRLAQTSVWDKDNGENEAKGWYAWDQYLDMLRARGAGHTAAVETKVKFDLRMAYPKLLFSASRWLNPDEAATAKTRIDESAEVIETILSGLGNDGVAGKPAGAAAPTQPSGPDVDEAEVAAAAAAKVAAAEAAKKAAAKAAKKAAADKALAEAQAAADAAAAEDDDAGDGGFGGLTAAADVRPKPAAKAATAGKAPKAAAATPVEQPATVVEGTPAGLADLLSGWDA